MAFVLRVGGIEDVEYRFLPRATTCPLGSREGVGKSRLSLFSLPELALVGQDPELRLPQ